MPGDHDTIVTTPMSNVGLETSLKKHGITMVRAKVGDRHVVEAVTQPAGLAGPDLHVSHEPQRSK